MTPRTTKLSGFGLVLLLGAVLCLSRMGFAAPAGSFSVLTYNVAGLPGGFSSSTPEVNNALISPLLNAFDLVAVQEDFGFHNDLISQVTHPHLSIKDTSDSQVGLNVGVPPGLGDGLNRMSDSPFTDFQRVTWDTCSGVLTNGSDCLAPKGFSVGRHEIAPGLFVDMYNFHADSGAPQVDINARQVQLRQLDAFIGTFSNNNAVIVMGDTNSFFTRNGDILPEFLQNTGLQDVWVEIVLNGTAPSVGPRLNTCAENGLSGSDCEQKDKIFFRSGVDVELVPTAYDVPSALFSDALGAPLSDHEPVSATFGFSAIPEPRSVSLLVVGFILLGVVLTRIRWRARLTGGSKVIGQSWLVC